MLYMITNYPVFNFFEFLNDCAAFMGYLVHVL